MTSLSQKTINNSLTRSNKTEITEWGIPDFSAGIAPTFPFTCPCDGLLWLKGMAGIIIITIDDRTDGYIFSSYGPTISYSVSHTYIVAKGQELSLSRDSCSISQYIFFPMKGEI